MPAVKIEPSSANGFIIELYEYQGKKGDVLVGTLECNTDGKKLYIVRRENDFQDFQVIGHYYGKDRADKELPKTHSITIVV